MLAPVYGRMKSSRGIRRQLVEGKGEKEKRIIRKCTSTDTGAHHHNSGSDSFGQLIWFLQTSIHQPQWHPS